MSDEYCDLLKWGPLPPSNGRVAEEEGRKELNPFISLALRIPETASNLSQGITVIFNHSVFLQPINYINIK